MIYLISTKKDGSSFSKEMVWPSTINQFGAKDQNPLMTKKKMMKKMTKKMITTMKLKRKEKKELKAILTLV
jgi:hypothetical protein